jgi:hypothetical protein
MVDVMKNLWNAMEEQKVSKEVVNKTMRAYADHGPEALVEMFLDGAALATAQILKARLSTPETAENLAVLYLQVSGLLSALAEDSKREMEVV